MTNQIEKVGSKKKMTELKGASVYKTAEHIVITGEPEKGHNCDQMGCGQEHVIYRFFI